MKTTNQSAIEKEYYTWSQYQKDITSLAKGIQQVQKQKFQSIYGIPRGGLIVAVSLAHISGIPMILSRADITPNTLIVDNIADTGSTIDNLCRQLGYRPTVVTLYCHPQSTSIPDKYIRTKSRWVVFPWEVESSSKYDGTAL